MKGWSELKEAFWASVESAPAEQARRMAALASIDPELPGRLEALLAADARGESLQHIFESRDGPHRPASAHWNLRHHRRPRRRRHGRGIPCSRFAAAT